MNLEEIYNKNNNSYEAAKLLNIFFPQIDGIILKIRTEHPKYGIKKIKELALNKLSKQLLTENRQQLEIILDNYFLYENCGFNKLQQKKTKLYH